MNLKWSSLEAIARTKVFDVWYLFPLMAVNRLLRKDGEILENEGEKMAAKSKIEWTENTWNPVTGCTKISDGCKNCYAYTLANRLKLMRNKKYENAFNVTLHEKCLTDPLNWKKPSLIFVNSMSDLFHEDIPADFIQKVFAVMNQASWHTFQVKLIRLPCRAV